MKILHLQETLVHKWFETCMCEEKSYIKLLFCLDLPSQNINDNFWQAIRLFMFQGECVINWNNLCSKPDTPVLTLGQTYGKASWEVNAIPPVWHPTTTAWVHLPFTRILFIIIIIINKFNGNSTELDSHIHSTYKHIKYKAIKMRRNMIRHVIRKVIHTHSIAFVSNTILTYIKCRINRNYCQWYSPHGISELRYLFVRISGNGYLLKLRTSYLLHLWQGRWKVCGFHYFLEIFFAQAISSFLQTR